ncbi:UDP-N-acetylmuramyl pentapeptide phosphotransferase/UDP-N-acetylglucosamine-1-phosphate transferase [Caldanaerobius fijiensis DSM 17918]|uniref:UDP-N-acetylmuramyl pentapeptide phosphotransferase/UDP-N-acetylglucosamine-1-phosphate transferase n=1 Tax=Caldanaerobius fijiensis DSM 17918 TaxID=1121256 RepID=A0A1M4U9P5_9THEO|nr:hypothetical protein [Caldanaerobius fijiensis]SHE53404.1 UDP-N-acetylmuramyl pentapeptide phosphotransferase/UDP-N-acetylglucosamine-1-phosphate transferase [Caldanaerobius fijiensis DSM 17918]
MTLIIFLLLFILSVLLSLLFIPLIESMFVELNCTCVNYKGQNIPTGMGIAAIPVVILVGTILYFISKDIKVIVVILSAVFMALVGLLDDLIGQKGVKGFKGHIKELIHYHMTTGGLKAVIGFLTALFISVIVSSTYIDIFINTVLIALFTNTLNLMDLRPGRALKVSILLFVLFAIFAHKNIWLLIPVMGFVAAYFPRDIKAFSMLGDTGSNLLGSVVGVYTAISFSFDIRLIIALLLILLQIIAEKYSITKLIESNSILKFFDELGRI